MELMHAAVTGMECAEADTPLGALSQFYRAFNNRNLELMRRNWHQEECVLDNPLGGIRRGWAEIEPLYASLFNGPARVRVVFFDYTLHVGGDLFCAAGGGSVEHSKRARQGLTWPFARAGSIGARTAHGGRFTIMGPSRISNCFGCISRRFYREAAAPGGAMADSSVGSSELGGLLAERSSRSTC